MSGPTTPTGKWLEQADWNSADIGYYIPRIEAEAAAQERARLAAQFRISGSELRAALRSLGPPGTKAEGYVFAAASWVADALLAEPTP